MEKKNRDEIYEGYYKWLGQTTKNRQGGEATTLFNEERLFCNGLALHHYDLLRFYPDKTVIHVSVMSLRGFNLEKILEWFTKDNPNNGKGTYKVEGKMISFECKCATGSIAFVGEVVGEKLVLDSYSLINGHVATAREYEEVKL